MMLIATNDHPVLKSGTIVHAAMKPQHLKLTQFTDWYMSITGKIHYSERKLNEHINKGYIKIVT